MPPRRRRPSPPRLGIQPCPGLSADGRFTDSRGRTHDLATAATLCAKEVSADPRMGRVMSSASVLRLIHRGELYPVARLNQRTVRIYECAIADYFHRLNRVHP